MNKRKFPYIFFGSLAAVLFGMLVLLTVLSLQDHVVVLNPKGAVGLKQRDLIVNATLLMLIVVIPALVLTYVFAWLYRASNERAKYTPDWDKHNGIEAIWWGLPCAIVLILGVIGWKSCHELDPFKPLQSEVKPIRIQAVALQWKWLFIYPEYNVAAVNFAPFPEKTPLDFDITSDAPMNSFWIPQLGGQVYAMPGMRSKLHLIADEPGSFRGCSANLSGEGFSGMTFTAKASTREEFEAWVQSVQSSSNLLTLDSYDALLRPSQYAPVETYALRQEDLFERILMKYMTGMK